MWWFQYIVLSLQSGFSVDCAEEQYVTCGCSHVHHTPKRGISRCNLTRLSIFVRSLIQKEWYSQWIKQLLILLKCPAQETPMSTSSAMWHTHRIFRCVCSYLAPRDLLHKAYGDYPSWLTSEHVKPKHREIYEELVSYIKKHAVPCFLGFKPDFQVERREYLIFMMKEMMSSDEVDEIKVYYADIRGIHDCIEKKVSTQHASFFKSINFLVQYMDYECNFIAEKMRAARVLRSWFTKILRKRTLPSVMKRLREIKAIFRIRVKLRTIRRDRKVFEIVQSLQRFVRDKLQKGEKLTFKDFIRSSQSVCYFCCRDINKGKYGCRFRTCFRIGKQPIFKAIFFHEIRQHLIKRPVWSCSLKLCSILGVQRDHVEHLKGTKWWSLLEELWTKHWDPRKP